VPLGPRKLRSEDGETRNEQWCAGPRRNEERQAEQRDGDTDENNEDTARMAPGSVGPRLLFRGLVGSVVHRRINTTQPLAEGDRRITHEVPVAPRLAACT
jgi:hypothetical protein